MTSSCFLQEGREDEGVVILTISFKLRSSWELVIAFCCRFTTRWGLLGVTPMIATDRLYFLLFLKKTVVAT